MSDKLYDHNWKTYPNGHPFAGYPTVAELDRGFVRRLLAGESSARIATLMTRDDVPFMTLSEGALIEQLRNDAFDYCNWAFKNLKDESCGGINTLPTRDLFLQVTPWVLVNWEWRGTYVDSQTGERHIFADPVATAAIPDIGEYLNDLHRTRWGRLEKQVRREQGLE